jgi:GDPmannose 4,6-dehydratase
MRRPTEVDRLLGDSSKARRVLGFEPRVSFGELVGMMVENDLELAEQERTLIDAGHQAAFRGAGNV